MDTYPYVDFEGAQYEEAEMQQRADDFYTFMDRRRSLRDFSSRDIPSSVIAQIIRTAATAPSGAHKQPWTFCAIHSAPLKKQIRQAAEEEEKLNYSGRMNEEWVRDLAPLGTNWEKPFLETAPWLIVLFRKPYDIVDGQKKQNYYVNESVGIAAGFLLAAIHHAGLVTLTHTPSPMQFLEKILERPKNEKAYLLLPVGYALEGAQVPDIQRKPLEEVCVWK